MATINYTKSYLSKLEQLFSEAGYKLRYEKGNFKSGYCILNNKKLVIINKFYDLEGKINSLLEIIRLTHIDKTDFSDATRSLYLKLTQIKT